MKVASSLAWKRKALFERFIQGDDQALGQLLTVYEHRKRIEKIAIKNTRGTSVTWEDAVQTAYIKVFQAARSGKFRRGKVEEFYHWATKVSRLAIIDLVRREMQRHHTSLDQVIANTNLSLLEVIPDQSNLEDTLEYTDLVVRAIRIVKILNQRYPQRNYLKLWLGKTQGRTQTQLARDLGLTQSAISKRWRELVKYLAQELD